MTALDIDWVSMWCGIIIGMLFTGWWALTWRATLRTRVADIKKYSNEVRHKGVILIGENTALRAQLIAVKCEYALLESEYNEVRNKLEFDKH